ncbi:hypothetical protein MMYC01_200045 [Madurella mycetomatis]|uniref:Uncharacterized protein n=1 Tax=Madurella mycetomatis TaxID=100816 RepID=A0A150ASE6_9PEZI|nr:hypothetical protein MMYC01_200045 [Madurella mycetomatis]
MNRRMEGPLQMIEELGGFYTLRDLRVPVAVLSANSTMEACSAIISEREVLSTVTAETVRFLGYEPRDLPEDYSRRSFLSYWNDTIRPRRYVSLVVEQRRYGLDPIIKDFIILDDDVKDRKVDLVLGNQPLKVGATGGREDAQQSRADAQSGLRNTTDPAMNDAAGNSSNLSANITSAHRAAPPPTPVGVPLICSPGWSQQGAQPTWPQHPLLYLSPPATHARGTPSPQDASSGWSNYPYPSLYGPTDAGSFGGADDA